MKYDPTKAIVCTINESYCEENGKKRKFKERPFSARLAFSVFKRMQSIECLSKELIFGNL